MKARTHNRLRPGHRRLRLLAASAAGPRLAGSTLVVVLATVSIGLALPPGGAVIATTAAFGAVGGRSFSDWATVEAQLPTNSGADPLATLGAVACPADGSCVATGDYTDTSGNQQGLIETLSGGVWTATEAPLPPTPGTDPLVSLDGLACPSDGSCVATGNYTDSTGSQQGLIETLSGGVWSATKAPVPAGAGSNPLTTINAPACPTDGWCVATGNYTDSIGTIHSTIDTLSGGVWGAVEAELPATGVTNDGSSIGAAACPADGFCVAMAGYTDTSGNVQTAVETLTGGIWTPTEAALPPGEAADGQQRNLLGPVDCVAQGVCTAVGSFAPSSGNFQGLIETLSGGTWTPLAAPLPANAPTTEGFAKLDDVTCPAAGVCAALGWYYDTNGDYHALMETQSGGVWTPTEQKLPTSPGARNPSNPDQGLGNVTCETTAACVTVGSYFDSSQKDKSIIATLAAGNWGVVKAPVPTKADANLQSNLHSVACSSDGSCVAVGSVGGDPLIEALPGGQTAPVVSSADNATFTVDVVGSFTVTATGTPTPVITKRGRLPKGLHFTSGTGTATISGTPLGAPGTFAVTIQAQNGVLPTASQFLTLTIAT